MGRLTAYRTQNLLEVKVGCGSHKQEYLKINGCAYNVR